MASMKLFCDSIEVRQTSGPDITDITLLLARCVEGSGVAQGTLSASVIGSTGSLTTIEFEPGAVEDLKAAIERLAPQGMSYAHEMAWHDGNGQSHVQAALLGPSLSLPIRNHSLRLGPWQQVVVVNHDTRSRKRTIEVTIVGTVD
jgi:secondary thiamine-phosphate synthase enzyme